MVKKTKVVKKVKKGKRPKKVKQEKNIHKVSLDRNTYAKLRYLAILKKKTPNEIISGWLAKIKIQ